MSDGSPRTLFLSPFFHPEKLGIGAYNTSLVSALRDGGHQVTVLASHPLYPEWKPTRWDRPYPGVRVIRRGGRIRYPRSQVLRRLVLEGWYAQAVTAHLRRSRGRYDRVLIHAPPTFFMPLLPTLTDPSCRVSVLLADLQYVHAAQSRSGRLVRPMVRWLEGRSLRAADRVVTMSHEMAERVSQDLGVARGKLSVAYPAPTLGDDSGEARAPAGNGDGDPEIRVVYSGALGVKQDPAFLLRVLEDAVRAEPRLRAVVRSEGHLFTWMRENRSADVADRLAFDDLVPVERLAESYRASDVQLLPQKPGTSTGSMPSKVPNLIATRTPIFAISDRGSEIARVLNAYPGGRVVASGSSVGEVSRALVRFARDARRVRERLRDRDPEVARLLRERFSMEHMVDLLMG